MAKKTAERTVSLWRYRALRDCFLFKVYRKKGDVISLESPLPASAIEGVIKPPCPTPTPPQWVLISGPEVE